VNVSGRRPDTWCPRRCSIPIPAVSRSPGLARYRVVHVPRDACMEKVRPGTGRGAGLGHAGSGLVPQVTATAVWLRGAEGGGGTAPRSALRAPVPSSGKPRRVVSRSVFHRSDPRAKRCPTLGCEAISLPPAVVFPAAPGPLFCASRVSFVPHQRSGGCEFRRLSGCR